MILRYSTLILTSDSVEFLPVSWIEGDNNYGSYQSKLRISFVEVNSFSLVCMCCLLVGSNLLLHWDTKIMLCVGFVDDGPGSLREGCRKQEPLWILFEVSGTIHLSSYLSVSSYKTIDGRGRRVKLTGKGLRLKECEHIIICNLEFEGGRGHDVDGIQIKPNSRHIWIDRCSLRDYDDGLIDITRQSTDITISRWV